ncbi:MAG: MliC family protein [Thermodesulfobacteriota bacterium]
MKTDRAFFLYIGILLFFFILTGCSSPKGISTQKFLYQCDEGKTLWVEFDSRAEMVMLTIDRRWIYLPRVPSASGAKYSDGNSIFWMKGEVASIEIDRSRIFQNCRPQP